MRGLYIHIPFCVRKCAYCDFYSLPAPEAPDSYIQAVLEEARQYRGLSFRTLYLGGGTPGLLGPQRLTALLDGLRSVLDLSGLVEATMESNPDSTTPQLLEAAAAGGINRLSLGVQSLSDIELERVGRIHTASQALKAIQLARDSGFLNISCDVILGLPGQDWHSLKNTLETLISLDITHLSLYCLTVEPQTPLSLKSPADLPSDDEQAEMYAGACSLLQTMRYVHYEISNFSLPGSECLHNQNYWRGGEYLGLGPAAASHLKGKRFKNRPDLQAYLRNPTCLTGEMESLDAGQKACEEAILRLRLLQEGLDIRELAARFGEDNIRGLKERLDSLADRELLARSSSTYRLPESLALVSNPILAKILGG